MPPPLFKYLSVASADAVLANSSLRWAAPRTFNDPFDVQAALALNVEDDAVVRRALELFADRFVNPRPAVNHVGMLANVMYERGVRLTENQVVNEFKETFEESLRRLRRHIPTLSAELINGLANSKLLCLSASESVAPMWAHYAENHQGVVLEFEAKPGVDSAFKTARPIFYSNSPPDFLDQETLSRVLAGDQNFEVVPTLLKIVYHKAEAWAYEQEWRIWSGDGRSQSADFEYAGFFRSDLSRVIFGLRSSEANRFRWERLARQINDQVRFSRIVTSGERLMAI